MLVWRQRQGTDNRDSCGTLGSRMSCIRLAYCGTNHNGRHINLHRLFPGATSSLIHQVSPGSVLAAI